MTLILVYSSHSTDVIHTLNPQLQQAAVDSYADALRVIFIFQAACNILSFLACLPIQEHDLPSVRSTLSCVQRLISGVLTSGTHEEQQKHDMNRNNSQNTDAEQS
jgi:hypothetical protein